MIIAGTLSVIPGTQTYIRPVQNGWLSHEDVFAKMPKMRGIHTVGSVSTLRNADGYPYASPVLS